MSDRKPKVIKQPPKVPEKQFVLRESEAVTLRRKLLQMIDELDKFMGKDSGRKMV